MSQLCEKPDFFQFQAIIAGINVDKTQRKLAFLALSRNSAIQLRHILICTTGLSAETAKPYSVQGIAYR